jgi:hypothetical protein
MAASSPLIEPGETLSTLSPALSTSSPALMRAFPSLS